MHDVLDSYQHFLLFILNHHSMQSINPIQHERFLTFLSLRMKVLRDNTWFYDSTSVVKTAAIYTMKPVGLGWEFFHVEIRISV